MKDYSYELLDLLEKYKGDHRKVCDIVQTVVYHMFLTLKACTAHGEKILAALQCHLLGKGNIVDIAVSHRFDVTALIHGVRSGDLQ